jgi:hypothetical protein
MRRLYKSELAEFRRDGITLSPQIFKTTKIPEYRNSSTQRPGSPNQQQYMSPATLTNEKPEEHKLPDQMSATIVNMGWNHLGSISSLQGEEYMTNPQFPVESRHAIKRKPAPKINSSLLATDMKDNHGILVSKEQTLGPNQGPVAVLSEVQSTQWKIPNMSDTEDGAVDVLNSAPSTKPKFEEAIEPLAHDQASIPPPTPQSTTTTEPEADMISKFDSLQWAGVPRQATPGCGIPQHDEVVSHGASSSVLLSPGSGSEDPGPLWSRNSASPLRERQGHESKFEIESGLEVLEPRFLSATTTPINNLPSSAFSPVSSVAYSGRDLSKLAFTTTHDQSSENQPGLEVLRRDHGSPSPPPPFTEPASPDVAIVDRPIIKPRDKTDFESGLEVDRQLSVKSRTGIRVEATIVPQSEIQGKLNIPLQQHDVDMMSMANSASGESTSTNKRSRFFERFMGSSKQRTSNSTFKLPQHLEYSFSSCGHRILLWSKKNSARVMCIIYPFERGSVYDLARLNTMVSAESNDANVSMRFVAANRDCIAIVAYADEVSFES